MTQDEIEHDPTHDRPLPGDGTYPAVQERADQQPPEDRPMPGDGTRDTGAATERSGETTSDDTDESAGDTDAGGKGGDGEGPPPGPDAEPVYNDRDKLDFDPDEGLYTGTAVTGDTEIPGEHERVDDVPVEEDDDAGKSDSADGSA